MTIACTDCGTEIKFRSLTNGTYVCECPNAECRADFMAHGQTKGEAADKLVQRCEQYGYVRHLAARMQSLAAEVPQGDLFA